MNVKSATQLLEKILSWVRIGFAMDFDSLLAWRVEVSRQIARLEEGLAGNCALLDPPEQLKFICLRSEFHDLLGQTAEAAEILKPHVVMIGGELIPRVEGLGQLAPSPNPEAPDYDAEKHARWIRQIIWLHMQFVWVVYFRRGDFEVALEYFNRIERFIESRLVSIERPSHGTKFRLYYYRAHCERALRRFKQSLHSFKEANSHAKRRYEQKRQKLFATENDAEVLSSKLAREKCFAIVCIARILGGGLAWNAIHQGRLMRAQELGLSAETLLMETGQEPLKLFIRSNMAIARRRASPARGRTAYLSMSELVRLYFEYRRAGDDLGQLRCGFEYVRGHIDFLSCWRGNTIETARSIRQARSWLDRVIEIASRVPDPAWRERERLLRKRMQLAIGIIARRDGPDALPPDLRTLSPGTDLDIADPQLDDEMMRAHLPSSRSEELAVEKHILVVLDRLSRPMTPSRIKESIAILERALGRMADEPDPVVQSECRLVLAQLHLAAVDFRGVRDELDHWRARSTDIENAYLHRMAQSIEESLEEGVKPFVIRPNEENLEWKKWEKELRLWLARAARQKTGPQASGKAIAETLGIDASSWSRWPK